ncbi:MAG: hypothetical protein KGZ38_09745 [Erysipelothrix sp.]|nr:hypothetical protein [Erysipelothrix sp.]MBS3988234.1 hypothetical protein [Erysipelothrix sp.]
MLDIFSKERRIELISEVKKVDKYLCSQVYSVEHGTHLDFYELTNEIFMEYPYRLTANTFQEYLEDLGFELDYNRNYLKKWTFENQLDYLQLIVNIFHWIDLSKQKSQKMKYYHEIVLQNYSRITQNVKLILERVNYNIFVDEDKVRFIKRDYLLDSALNSITDEKISNDLLSYRDFRTSKNLLEKKSIIARLFTYYERPENNEFKSYKVQVDSNQKLINLSDDFAMICNNFDIRHYPKEISKIHGQLVISDVETHQLCDIAFDLFLQMYHVTNLKKATDSILQYKKKYLSK